MPQRRTSDITKQLEIWWPYGPDPRGKEIREETPKELQQLASVELTPETAEAKIAGQTVGFRIDVERRAAWQLYVELNTRIATQPLKASEGLLREALSSLHAVFGITREILKEAGPVVAQGRESLGFYAMEILNQILRPILAKWHPALSDWENQRPTDISSSEHEKKWKHAQDLRREIERTRKNLVGYCAALALLAGVSSETKGT